MRWSRESATRPAARLRSTSRSTSARRSRRAAAPIAEVGELVEAVRASPLPLAGLMAIPPLGLEPAPFFALLAKLARRHDVMALSMGMSADYKAAVMLGATAVRVGTALFED